MQCHPLSRPRVERYRRRNPGAWIRKNHDPGDAIKLTCIDLDIPIEARNDGLDTTT